MHIPDRSNELRAAERSSDHGQQWKGKWWNEFDGCVVRPHRVDDESDYDDMLA
jgi:hypothetical protein